MLASPVIEHPVGMGEAKKLGFGWKGAIPAIMHQDMMAPTLS